MTFKKHKKNRILYLILTCLLALIEMAAKLYIAFNLLSIALNGLEDKSLRHIILGLTILGVLTRLNLYIEKDKRKALANFNADLRKEFSKIVIFEKNNIDDHLHTAEAGTHIWMNVEWTGIYYYEAIAELVKIILESFIGTIYVSYLDFKLALLYILPISLAYISNKRSKKSIEEAGKKESDLSMKYSSLSLEGLKADVSLKTLNSIDIYLDKLKKKSKDLRKASMEFVNRTNILFGKKELILIFFQYLSILLILKKGIIEASNLKITGFNIIMIFYLFNNIKRMEGSMLKLSKGRTALGELVKRFERTSDIKEEEPREQGVSREKDLESQGLIIKNLSYTYRGKNEATLSNINMTFHSNEKVYLVGESGSGKSTLIKLINGFCLDYSGELSINGRDLTSENLDEIRSEISTVWQKNHIFSDSVLENIRIAKKDASFKEVMEACKKANIYDYIMGLEEGFETKIGQGGYELSGGQKQRIAIARAYLRDSQIIILDEPTSQLDRANENEIIKNLEDLSKGKLLIGVSHRIENIVDADKIYLLKNGQVKDEGNHQELLTRSEEYKRLFKLKGSLGEGQL